MLEKDIIQQVQLLQQEHTKCKNDLLLEEVLLDRNLAVRTEKRIAEIEPILDAYKKYIDAEKQYEEILPNELQFFKKEFEEKDNILNDLKNKLVMLLNLLKSKVEYVTMEISSQDKLESKLLKDIVLGYLNFFKKNNFDYSLIKTSECGYQIDAYGKNVFKIMNEENGVHACDNQKVQVLVYPSVKNEVPSFMEKDIKIDIYRSNGAGGQNVNKIATAVRITHLKTGIVCTCQDERSQFQNKERAMQNLKEKVLKLASEQYNQKLSETKKKYFNNKIVKKYDYNQDCIKNVKNNKIYQLSSFVDGSFCY